jgi:hypothetical protein
MTESELRRKAKLFMHELGAADAVAGLPARTSAAKELQTALQLFLDRYQPGAKWSAFTEAFNSYAKAHRHGEVAEHGVFDCGPCGARPDDVERILDHIVSVRHMAHAEGAAARKRGAA